MLCFDFISKLLKKVYNKNNSKLCFLDMKIMSFRNVVDLVNKFHIKKIQFTILYMSRVMRKPTFWFPTWSDTNQAVQLQKMARDLKFRI